MDTHNSKIAFVTDDGTTISPHFGRARYFEVVTLENGVETHRERREKSGHHTFAREEHHHEHGSEGHGYDHASRKKHQSMLASITDCRTVVARGMGSGAYQHLAEANITPIVTGLKEIDAALQAFVEGSLVNHVERLH